MSKQLLIIKAASDICASEVDHLKAIAGMFGIQDCTMELTDMANFEQQLCKGQTFDFIYLGAHADTEYFGESDGSKKFSWDELGTAFCSSGCLNHGAILLLGCCRGGLKKVAYQLFCACDQIDYVCGPRWTVTGADISAGFHVFIYNMVVRHEQPSTAVKRASKGTGYDFFCYDRIELEDEVERYCGEIII